MLASKSITSLESVLDLAVWLEKHGREYYEKAEASATDADVKTLFSFLASEEQKHCAIYSDLYEFYTGRSTENEELLGEYGKFIKLLIREIIGVLDFEGVPSQEELVERALKFEKNTLIFFNEVRPLFVGKAAAMVEAVCNEEKRHIRQLMEYRASLRGESTDWNL